MRVTRSLHRSPDLELRAGRGDKGKIMAGHAAVFNQRSCNLGWFFEIMEPGCFADALVDPELECYSLFNHEESRVLGVTTNGSVRLSEDKQGLYQETDLLGDTTDSTNMIAHLESKRISKMSFAFTIAPDGEQWDEDKDRLLIRTVTRVQRLFDVSPVTYPAYAATEVGLRSMPGMDEHTVNEIMGLLVRAENNFSMDKTGLATLKDFRARLEKLAILEEEAPEDPQYKGLTVTELRQRFYKAL